VRTGIALLLAAGLVGSLVACSTPADDSSQSTPGSSASCDVTKPGDASDSVSVEGDYGKAPTVEFDTPITTTATERTVVIEGDGPMVETNGDANVHFTLYNGSSGEELTTTGWADGATQSITVDESAFLVGLVKTLECTTVGSRVVGVIPPTDLWGETGSPDLGVDPADSVVFVADLIDIATGTFVPQKFEDMKGAPEVEFDADGAPTITIPDIAPPATSELGIITEGDGEVVGEDANVVVNYTGVNWTTGKVFDSSWERGEPSPFNTSGVVNGFGKAIEGQKVGTTLIVIISPIDGYGAAGNGGDIGGTDTIVFVVNIVSLGTAE